MKESAQLKQPLLQSDSDSAIHVALKPMSDNRDLKSIASEFDEVGKSQKSAQAIGDLYAELGND